MAILCIIRCLKLNRTGACTPHITSCVHNFLLEKNKTILFETFLILLKFLHLVCSVQQSISQQLFEKLVEKILIFNFINEYLVLC
jgi:hypothetical protein